MKILILLLTLISASSQAREIGNAYNPATGQTIYFNQDSSGFNSYDPSTGQTIYYNAN